MAKKQYYSRGKLLLTGEYAVLNGAKAIAIPTQKGQSLTVTTGRGSDIIWKSLDEKGNEWFNAKISLFDLEPIKSSNMEIAERLGEVLKSCVRLNSEFLSTWKGIKVQTRLEFPREWGWGSSATFLTNVSAWADVDPFELQDWTFGGSGYDIACAMSEKPILFQRDNKNGTQYSNVSIPSTILDKMTFFYTGKKQETSEALEYVKSNKFKDSDIQKLDKINDGILDSNKVEDWIGRLKEHNGIIAGYLKSDEVLSPFQDFEGVIKPLGAWGGDFMMALSKDDVSNVSSYLKDKGIKEIMPASEVAFLKEKVLTS